jgi:hypothetical protein
MEGILESTNEVLVTTNKTLLQAIGGTGYPIFLPVFPSSHPSRNEYFPVRIFYRTKDGLPLVDVNVDVMRRPNVAGTVEERFSPEVLDSIRNPQRYALGIILPGESSVSPLRLQAGNRYQLSMTTRRGYFYENVNIDAASDQAAGWRISWCLYRYRDNKLLDGKCD